MNDENENFQSSKSVNVEQIVEIKSYNDTLHTGAKVTKLLLSPNEKYAVTWNKECNSVCGWRIDDQNNQLYKPECSMNLDKNYLDPQVIAISNNKLIAVQSTKSENSIYKVIEVINLMEKTKITLETCRDRPFLDHHLSGCKFYNNGDLVIGAQILMLGETHYKIFIFSGKDSCNKLWKVNRSIACGISGEIKAYEITKGQKLMILDACGLLTQWDLNTLLFEKQYQLEWTNYALEIDLFIFNKEFSLLAVCLQVSNANIFIYVYLTENEMILSQIKYNRDNKSLLRSEFISSYGEERLLLFFEDAVEIRDPYCLEHVKYIETTSNLYEELSKSELEDLSELDKEYQKCLDILEAEFNMIINGKIYSVLNESLRVKDISKRQWKKYLREKLCDYDKIRCFPNKSQVEEFLKEIIEKYLNEEGIIIPEIKDSYGGALVKWVLKENGQIIQAQKLDKDNKQWKSVGSDWNILPVHIKENSRFVYRCELLGNEDLAMITSIGLLIWSIWKKDEIRLQYYMGFPFQASYLYEKYYENRFTLGTYKSEKFYEKMEFEAKGSNMIELLKKIQECRDDNCLARLYSSICSYCYKFMSKPSRLISEKNSQELSKNPCSLSDLQECKKISLPPPDFDAITPFYDKLCMYGRCPLKELLEDYVEDKVILALYGQELISSILKNKDYQMMKRLYEQCIKINMETEEKNLLANIKLLEIITFSFMDLSVKFPDLLKVYLSRISFILSSMNKEIAVGSSSSESHLQSHREYSRPHMISLYIKSNKWEETFEAPFISDTLKIVAKSDVDSVEELLKEFKKVKTEEETIEELKNSLKNESINKLLEIKKVKAKEEIIQKLRRFLGEESQGNEES
ncbi:3863_t:CDS:2 [Cetraspora pellucida]|uniref:3863_t:CDS:1 n=1 Tax=Cetraspora pellucida TaxID=1433469 RepID=A0ACA9K783_9GLOM|nr:3863_t:CDS:2 [Cetraspora pellucida]